MSTNYSTRPKQESAQSDEYVEGQRSVSKMALQIAEKIRKGELVNHKCPRSDYLKNELVKMRDRFTLF